MKHLIFLAALLLCSGCERESHMMSCSKRVVDPPQLDGPTFCVVCSNPTGHGVAVSCDWSKEAR